MSSVLLIRHGQASFGAANYDVLSAAGERQAELVGAAFRQRGVVADTIIAGTLTRQVETARRTSVAAGWSPAVVTDPSWDEFDRDDVLSGLRTASGVEDLTVADLDAAIGRWSAAGPEGTYGESFDAFRRRTTAVLERLAADADAGTTVAVFTSAGVISAVAAHLLKLGADQWWALNRVAVNTGVTTLVLGRRGVSLVSYNEHAHLPRKLVTYV